MCSNVGVEDFSENDKTDLDEKSPIIDVFVFVFAFDLDSDAILLRYSNHAELTERLHSH